MHIHFIGSNSRFHEGAPAEGVPIDSWGTCSFKCRSGLSAATYSPVNYEYVALAKKTPALREAMFYFFFEPA